MQYPYDSGIYQALQISVSLESVSEMQSIKDTVSAACQSPVHNHGSLALHSLPAT